MKAESVAAQPAANFSSRGACGSQKRPNAANPRRLKLAARLAVQRKVNQIRLWDRLSSRSLGATDYPHRLDQQAGSPGRSHMCCRVPRGRPCAVLLDALVKDRRVADDGR